MGFWYYLLTVDSEKRVHDIMDLTLLIGGGETFEDFQGSWSTEPSAKSPTYRGPDTTSGNGMLKHVKLVWKRIDILAIHHLPPYFGYRVTHSFITVYLTGDGHSFLRTSDTIV
jgi:hypothetical protein